MTPSEAVATELEEEVEEEVLEEEEETTAKSEVKTTKERKRFHGDNVYTFETEEAALEHIKADNIVYEDDSPVPGLRIHKMVKGQVTDSQTGEITTEGQTTSFVVARNKSIACELWCEAVHNTQALLARPMRRGGKGGKRKIDANLLFIGKTIAMSIFVDGDPNNPQLAEVNADYLKSFEIFEPIGDYAHYLDDNRAWKEPTTSDK